MPFESRWVKANVIYLKYNIVQLHNALFYFLSITRCARAYVQRQQQQNYGVCGRADLKVKYLSKQVVATFFDLVNHFF